MPIDQAVKAIQSIGASGEGFDRAIPAAAQLQQLPSSVIPRVLDGAAGVNPIAENWIRGVVFGIAKNSGPPSMQTLQSYVENRSNNPIGRGLALELVRQQDPVLAKAMIDASLNDSSLAIREMAVEQAIATAGAQRRTRPRRLTAIASPSMRPVIPNSSHGSSGLRSLVIP